MKKKYEKPKIITHEVIIENCVATASVVFGSTNSSIQIEDEIEDVKTQEWTFNP